MWRARAWEWKLPPCIFRRDNSWLSLTRPLNVAAGDHADGQPEECFVDVVASFPANVQAAEAVEPGDRALDNVAEDARTGAVGPAPVPRSWAGVRASGAGAGRCRGHSLVRSARRPGATEGLLASAARILSSRGSNWVTSLQFPPVSGTASGMFRPSRMRWCLLPGRVRSTVPVPQSITGSISDHSSSDVIHGRD